MQHSNLAIVDVQTGEIIPAGQRSLAELANTINSIIGRHEKDAWEIGRAAAEARAICDDVALAKAQGIEGDNPDARYGQWVSANFADTCIRRLHEYRLQFAAFGDNPKRVAFIPQSMLPPLANLPIEEREDCVKQLEAIHEKDGRVKVKDVQALLKHNHRAQGTGENEWYTPENYIEAAREVLQEFDLDPASSEIANQTVKAKHFYTIEDNGLEKPWFGKVWMNPPYSQPHIRLFAEKLTQEYQAGNVSEAIALTHNYTDTAWFHTMANACSAICFTRGRIGFLSPEGEKAAPTQGQAFFYFGDRAERFCTHFAPFGLSVKVYKYQSAA